MGSEAETLNTYSANKVTMLLFLKLMLVTMIQLTLLEAFQFPGDWEIIRQMMKHRAKKDKENGIQGGNMLRFGGSQVKSMDREDDFVYVPPPTTTTTPKTAVMELDPIMAAVMQTVNLTELEMRFAETGGLGLRGGFGEEEPPPPPVYRASDSIWNFTMSMIKSGLKEEETGNSLFSPISILTTINMLLLGTKGNTKAEIIQALGYPRYTSQVHTQFQQIIKSMNKDIGVQVVTSNALFTQVDNFSVKPSYKTRLRQHYGKQVEIVPVDFTKRPRTALQRMNRFVSSKTNNLIKNMFKHSVAPDTKIVASNCLYFNGTWEYEFLMEAGFTGEDGDFNSFRGKSIPVTYMIHPAFDFPYLKDDNLGMEILSLPYEHDVRNAEISEAHMFLLLPTRSGQQAFEELESTLVGTDFQDIFSRMKPVYGDLELPRMRLEFQDNLKPTLEKLGINRLFSGQPSQDFSPLTDDWDQLKLDTLQHKAVLKITEKGTEAAAATMAVQFYLGPSVSVRFDRPFFLFIYDALNKVVIFWARVVEPQHLAAHINTD